MRFSITVRLDRADSNVIASIAENAWSPIRYPNAVWDDAEQRLTSDAEVAGIPCAAIASGPRREHVDDRLIMRRVQRLNAANVETKIGVELTASDAHPDQEKLLAPCRHHAVVTDSPLVLIQAEQAHRALAAIEQVHADLRHGPLASLPSGSFQASSAWLVLGAIAFNLTRPTGCLALASHARATTGTIRAQPINVPARLAHSARQLQPHLPRPRPWEPARTRLLDATL